MVFLSDKALKNKGLRKIDFFPKSAFCNLINKLLLQRSMAPTVRALSNGLTCFSTSPTVVLVVVQIVFDWEAKWELWEAVSFSGLSEFKRVQSCSSSKKTHAREAA